MILVVLLSGINPEFYVTFARSGVRTPTSAVVKNPPANAGDTGSSPGLGKSHMLRSRYARAPQLLSLCSTAREPQLLSPRA